MSRGKYSPTLYSPNLLERTEKDYIYNAKGEIPPNPTEAGLYDPEIHFGNYDEDGFDSYGYSAYNAKGEYVGVGGDGVDRNGYTEFDYLLMTDNEFYNLA